MTNHVPPHRNVNEILRDISCPVELILLKIYWESYLASNSLLGSVD